MAESQSPGAKHRLGKQLCLIPSKQDKRHLGRHRLTAKPPSVRLPSQKTNSLLGMWLSRVQTPRQMLLIFHTLLFNRKILLILKELLLISQLVLQALQHQTLLLISQMLLLIQVHKNQRKLKSLTLKKIQKI